MVQQALTIAGSDSTGGAGIQADLKTFEEFGVFGFSTITSIVTMDATKGWQHQVHSIEGAIIKAQFLSAIASKNIAAVKTGMLGNAENAELVAELLNYYQFSHIVIDPVIACKGTANILQPDVVQQLKYKLMPLASITTPNLVEAGILAEIGDITNIQQMKYAAKQIASLGAKQVVIKGGHRLTTQEQACDLYYDGSDFHLLRASKIQKETNHGAGCTFSAALTAALALNFTYEQAVKIAKDFVHQAITDGLSINPYVGHVWHGAYFATQNRKERLQNAK